MSEPAGDTHETPSPLLSDYIQMAYLTLLFAVGAPLNLAACSELRTKRPNVAGGMARLHLLKIHLNFSDLLVVLVFTPSQVCWLLTYDWRGGDFMCRMIKFLHSFAFQSSSNIIVCIALNRLISVCRPGQNMDMAQTRRRLKITLMLAWIIAALICAPQLFLWKEFEASPNWKQCVTVWQIRAFIEWKPSNDTNGPSMHGEFYQAELAYNVWHLIFVFWLPVAGIALSYAKITHWLWQKSRSAAQCGESDSAQVSFGLASKQPNEVRGSRRMTKSTILSGCHSSKKVVEEMNPNSRIEILIQDDPRRESSKSSQTLTSEPRTSVEHSLEVRKVRQNAIRVSLLLISAYIVTWLPYHVLSLWELIDRKHFHEHTKQLDFAHGLIVFNSVINPFLYGMFGRFKRYTRSG